MLPTRPVEIDQRFYISADSEQTRVKKVSARKSYDPEPRGWVSYLDIIAILIAGGIVAVVIVSKWAL